MPEIAPLSPAEATVLLSPNLIKGRSAVKATLLLLLATGVLRIEETEEPGFFRNKKIAHLRIAAEPKNAPPEVAALLDVVRAAQAEGGKIKDVVKLAEKAFGPACTQFSVKFIIPALIARGLLLKKKFLFSHIFRLTPAGVAEQARLKSDLYKAADVARMLKSDPAQAAALAKTLGTNVLLSDKLTKQFKPLAAAMRANSGTDSLVFTDSGTHFGGHCGGFDFGCFDLGSFDLGSFDAGAIDAVHSGMGSFDAGFSDGGGGHDGGGGGHH
ncbi:MAG TPA: hypothetical protein VJX48_07415 [Xanthobacteraceae bacterium]|nr:hypothetical protein [Xanthobacteraceae bacterium]